MLSLSDSSFYVFEPLRSIHWSDSALEDWNAIDKEAMGAVMEGVMDCDQVNTIGTSSL